MAPSGWGPNKLYFRSAIDPKGTSVPFSFACQKLPAITAVNPFLTISI